MRDLTVFVDPRQGVDNNGNTVIGPARPNASVNPGPDTARGGHSGYFSGQEIRGFSQIHASGTGWGKYGEFLISPQIGLNCTFTGHDSPPADETATCFEYAVTLTRYGIRCSVTPAEHSAVYRFVYPESDDASLLFDMAHSIPLLCGIMNNADKISASGLELHIGADGENTVFSGSGTYDGGFGPAHRLHFYAVVGKKAESFGVYDADGCKDGSRELAVPKPRRPEESVGGYMRFSAKRDEEIYVKIAVSFTGTEKAKTWLDQEIPGWDYEGVKRETREQWNRELNKIIIEREDLSEDELKIFYTSFYHTMCMPRDRTGDIPGYPDSVPVIDDHYADWDSWRTLYSFYTLVKPELVTKTINSFIARHAKNGFVRDAFIGGKDMMCQQGGDNADNIIAEAYLKRVPGIDWKKAYEVVKCHAEGYRQGWYCEEEPKADPGAPYYQYGYIPDDYAIPGTEFGPMSASYTLELAYNDWCAASMARDLGTPEEYETFLRRSGNWENLWNPDAAYREFRGFINPRNADGSWVNYDPGKLCGSWQPYFYEATGYNYSLFVPHNVPKLIEKCGGDDAFIRRVRYGIDTNLVDYDNEPAFLAAYLPAWTGKPWVLADTVESVRRKFTPEGPPGNDDSGAMGSWYIFSSVGFFPNAGQDLYLITSPHYTHTVIRLGNGKTIDIRANNLSAENRYIQKVSVNGKPYCSAMFTHDLIENGAQFVFEMGSTPANFAARQDGAPPPPAADA